MKTRIARPEKWKQTVSIRLNKDVAAILEKRALKEKVTVSALVRQIVEEQVKAS
jgi:hypothetical protein